MVLQQFSQLNPYVQRGVGIGLIWGIMELVLLIFHSVGCYTISARIYRRRYNRLLERNKTLEIQYRKIDSELCLVQQQLKECRLEYLSFKASTEKIVHEMIESGVQKCVDIHIKRRQRDVLTNNIFSKV